MTWEEIEIIKPRLRAFIGKFIDIESLFLDPNRTITIYTKNQFTLSSLMDLCPLLDTYNVEILPLPGSVCVTIKDAKLGLFTQIRGTYVA